MMPHNDQTGSGRPPRGRLYQLMAIDHERLDDLLAKASGCAEAAAIESYQRFREGLLRHISIEEKIILPAARRHRGGTPLPLAERLRIDHGALASLMLLPPSNVTFRAVRAVLDTHNPLEDGPGGVYEQCEDLIVPELDEVLARCAASPKVPLSPWIDSPKVVAAARRMLMRCGYDGSLLDYKENRPSDGHGHR